MKKGVIIFIFVLTLFGIVGCNTPNKVNNEINKSYLFYSYSDGVAKNEAYFVDKHGYIKRLKTKKTSNVSENYYDSYSDSHILKNRIDCQLTVFDNNGNVNEFDPCEIGESYNGIVSHITYSKDTYFMVIDNGFDDEKYNNIIRIISKDLKHIKDIVVNQVFFDVLYFDNNLYYIKAGKDYQLNNDADIEEHIYKMNLENYQEKKININDEKKKKILMDSIMFNEGKLYILNARKNNEMCLSLLENKKIKDKKCMSNMMDAGGKQRNFKDKYRSYIAISSDKEFLDIVFIDEKNKAVFMKNFSDFYTSTLNIEGVYYSEKNNNNYIFKNLEGNIMEFTLHYPENINIEYGQAVVFFNK